MSVIRECSLHCMEANNNIAYSESQVLSICTDIKEATRLQFCL